MLAFMQSKGLLQYSHIGVPIGRCSKQCLHISKPQPSPPPYYFTVGSVKCNLYRGFMLVDANENLGSLYW